MNKNIARLRRAKSTRAHIRVLGVPRLSVLRTGQHLYAQVFTADGSKVLASANTTQADVKEGLKNGKNSDAAVKVGKLVAERAKAAGIEKVAFDRSGYRYHGPGRCSPRRRPAVLRDKEAGLVPASACLPARVAPGDVLLLQGRSIHRFIPQL
jgi:large subunit ribosomal protein L18